MKLLLDEDVPKPLLPIIQKILAEHQVDHVYDAAWGGKSDVDLFKDAAKRGYDAVLTNNIKQFNNPDECDAIKRSKLHHISYRSIDGLQGLALASAAICAAIRPIAIDLASCQGQRIVDITAVSANKKRFRMVDPSVAPPSAYWPGRKV